MLNKLFGHPLPPPQGDWVWTPHDLEKMSADVRDSLSAVRSPAWACVQVDPEDVVQETIVRVIESDALRRCGGPAQATAYAKRISRNLYVDLLRKSRIRRQHLAGQANAPSGRTSEPATSIDDKLTARSLIDTLSWQDQILVKLFFYQQLTAREVAAKLQVSTKTCQRHLARLIDRLHGLVSQRSADRQAAQSGRRPGQERRKLMPVGRS